jgi:hypothetical protein
MRAHRKTRQELDELAQQVVRGEIYIALDKEMLNLSFGWIFGMMDPPMSKSGIESIGAVYEEYSKAMPRAINGYPMFSSMRFVHTDDVERLGTMIDRKQRALDGTPFLRRALLRVMGR